MTLRSNRFAFRLNGSHCHGTLCILAALPHKAATASQALPRTIKRFATPIVRTDGLVSGARCTTPPTCIRLLPAANRQTVVCMLNCAKATGSHHP